MKPLKKSEFVHAMAACEAIVDRIKPLLGGHHPQIQGMVLAELTSIWLGGHPLEVREALLDVHCSGVRELVALSDQERAAMDGGAP